MATTKYDTLDHQYIIERYKERSISSSMALEIGVSTGLITKVLKAYTMCRSAVSGRYV